VVVVSDVSLMRHMMRGSTIVAAVRYLCRTYERKTPPYLAKSSGLNGLTANWITR
jgi:hypothetical protein